MSKLSSFEPRSYMSTVTPRICKHCRDIIPLDAKIVNQQKTVMVPQQLKKLRVQLKDKHTIHRCDPDTLKTIEQLNKIQSHVPNVEQ